MTSRITIEQNAKRLCIYIGESDAWRGKPLYIAILETLKSSEIAGATVLRGVAGFGAHSRIHTATILRLSEDLPLRIEVIDSPDKINKAIEVITPMVREGLITFEDVQVIRYTHRYLNPLQADKPIKEVMKPEVITLTPDMTIAQAWERMLEFQIKAMPVVDASEHVVGMLTDEDLIKRAGLQQRLSVAVHLDEALLEEQAVALKTSPMKVGDIMSQPAITAQISESLGLAASRLAKHGFKRLPIVDASGKLVGVLSRFDVLRQVIDVETKSHPFKPSDRVLTTIQQVMDAYIPTISQDTDLAGIVTALVETGLHRLVVVDGENRPIGLVSDSDVINRIQPHERRGVLRGLGGSKMPESNITAVDIMSPGVLTTNRDTPVLDALKEMMAMQRKWMVVVDQNGKLSGLVDRQVLLEALVT